MWSLLYDGGQRGRRTSPARRSSSATRRSALLLNVMGFLDDEEILAAAPLRVFLDIDPGFGQMWQELGLAEPFRGHDRYVTVGERIGAARLRDPDLRDRVGPHHAAGRPRRVDAGLRRRAALHQRRQLARPVRPDRVRRAQLRPARARVPAVRRAARAAARPRSSSRSTSTTRTIADLRRLREHGWTLVDPRAVAADPWRYRDYVRGSRAELMIAKNLYVDTRSGWFSDRSACYLASGRPVLAQDTGLDGICCPCGEGLLAFSDSGRGDGGGRRDHRRLRAPQPRGPRGRRGALRRRPGPRRACSRRSGSR